MAFDLIFRKNMGRNWSRELGETTPAADTIKTATNPQKIAKLKAIKEQAAAGDKKAQKKWAKICKKIAKVQVEAKKGNQQAAQNLITLRSAGIISSLPTVSGNDRLTEIITSGNDRLTEIISSGREEILGGTSPHRDDIEVANDGGSCERAALSRASGTFVGLTQGRQNRVMREASAISKAHMKNKQLKPATIAYLKVIAKKGNTGAQQKLRARNISW